MKRFTVNHKTVYRYRSPVSFGPHRLMIRPRDSHDMRLLTTSISIKPEPQLRWLHDVFGNSVAIASFDTPSDTLTVDSSIIVDRYDSTPTDFPIEDYARQLPFSYPTAEVPDLGRTIERHYPDPERRVTEWARQFLDRAGYGTSTEDFLLGVTAAIKDQFGYEIRHQPGTQAPIETLDRGVGSCRDFALLMMEAVRSVGLAARFVTGYLYDPSLDGQESDIQGAGFTHAWVQVYLPGAGWLEFDPTNGTMGGDHLLRVAVTREPEQAIPISGTFTGSEDDFLEMSVDVSVRASQLSEGAA